MSSRLAADLRKSFDIIGPYSPTIDKISDLHIRNIRISLKKNRNLSLYKRQVIDIIGNFEKTEKYEGHLTVNVDPA